MTSSPTLRRLAVLETGDGPLTLRRSWPRGDGRLLLDFTRADGSAVAGQWLADAAQGRAVAVATPGAHHLATCGVVLQPGGVDRHLRQLATIVAEPGATLIVHRPERRAVVRRPDRRFAKVVPPRKAARLLAADRLARATGAIDMPQLVTADVAGGVLEWAEVPGRALYDLLHDGACSLDDLTDAGRATGSALRALHDADVPQGLAGHSSEDEIANAAGWLDQARAHRALPACVELRIDAAAAVLVASDAPAVPIHRDLHEKQVMVADGHVTLIDVDTLAAGEAAVDVANFLVHLDLRVALGLPAERAAATARGFVAAYRPPLSVLHRVAAHAAITRVRLASLYAFRPQQAAAALRLLAPAATRSLVDDLG